MARTNNITIVEWQLYYLKYGMNDDRKEIDAN